MVWDPAEGIIIIANLLPNMLGAGMHGNVKNLTEQELEGAVSVGESCTASKRKKKPNPG